MPSHSTEKYWGGWHLTEDEVGKYPEMFPGDGLGYYWFNPDTLRYAGPYPTPEESDAAYEAWLEDDENDADPDTAEELPEAPEVSHRPGPEDNDDRGADRRG